MFRVLFLMVLLTSFINVNNAFGQCTVNITPSSAVICNSGGSVTLIASIVTNGSYLWSNNSTSTSITVTSGGTFTVVVTDTVTFQTCTASATVNYAPLDANFTFTPDSACAPANVQFTSTTTGTINSYAWNFGDPSSGNNSSSQQNTSHIYDTIGSGFASYTASLVVSNNAGCSKTLSQVVNVKKRPDASLDDYASNPNFKFTNCATGSNGNFNLTVTNTSTTSSENTNYNINWGDGSPPFNSSNYTTASHIYTSKGYFTLVLTVTNNKGCTSSKSYQVFNGSNPAISLGNPGSTDGCVPSSFTFPIGYTDNNGNPNAPGTVYTITVNDGSSPIIYTHPNLPAVPMASFTHIFDTTSCGTTSISGGTTFNNSFQVSITAENPCGSTGASVTPIKISTPPLADFTISPDTIVCVNTNVTFTNTSDEGLIVVGNNPSCDSLGKRWWTINPNTGWSITSGFVGIPYPDNNPGNNGTNIIGVNFSQSGVYNIWLNIWNGCGVDSISKQICVQPIPTASFTTNTLTGCAPLNITTTNTSNTLNTCGITTYNWTVSPINAMCGNAQTYSFTGGTNASSVNPQFSFTGAGKYTLKLAVTNECTTATFERIITVKDKPNVSATGISNICSPGTIDPNGTFCSNYDTITSITWSFIGGTPSSFTGSNPPPITYNTPGTYNISVSATNGCGTTTANYPIVVSSPPTPPVLSSNAPVCQGDTLKIFSNLVNGATYSWTGPNGFTANTQNIIRPNATTLMAGIYTLTISVGICTNNSSISVVVNLNPSVTAIASPYSICLGTSTTLNASGASTYIWSPATGLNTTTGPTVIASPASTSIYSVTGTDANGCKNTDTVKVTIKPLPTVSISNPNQTICLGSSATFTATGTVGSTFSWQPGGQSGPSITVSPNVIGTYTYTVTATHNGCTNTATATLNVISNPVVSAMASSPSICTGQSTTLTATGANTYTWQPGNLTGGSVSVSPTLTTTFTVTGAAGNNCSDTATITVIVNPLPNIAVSAAPSIICNGDTTTLTASGAVSYVWTPTGTLSGSTGNSVNAFPIATTTYTVTGTDVNGCSKSASVQVIVNPLPVVSAGPDITICNQPIGVQLNGTPTGSGGVWSGPYISGSGLFTPAATGAFTVYYTFTNNNGCKNKDSAVVTVINPAPVYAGPDDTLCLNASPLLLTGQSPTGGTWTGTGVSGNSFNPSIAGVGSHNLTYSIGSGNCLTTDTKTIVVHPLPNISISGDSIICYGDTTILTANGAINYTWSPVTYLSSNTGSTVAAFPPTSMTYIVTGTNSNGCVNSRVKNISVHQLPTVSAGPDTTLCNQPTPIQLTGSPAGGTWSGQGGVNPNGQFTPNVNGSFLVIYTFQDVNGCINSDSAFVNVINSTPVYAGLDDSVCISIGPFVLTGYTPPGGTWTGNGVTSNGTFTPSVAGAGTHSLVYSLGSGTCLVRDTVKMTVHPLPVVTINGAPAICRGLGTVLLASGANTYSWSPGTGLNTNAGPNVFAAPLTTTTYTVTGTDIYGCTGAASHTLTVHPLPTVMAAGDTTICNQPIPVQFTGTPANGTWSGAGITQSGLYTPSDTGTFTVVYTVTDNNNCSNKDTTLITVIDPPVVYAGVNDTFCLSDASVILSGASPSGGVWSGNGILNSSTGFFDPATAGAGLHNIVYSFGSGNCEVSDTIQILVHSLPVVNAGSDFSTCINSGVKILSGFSPQGGTWTGSGIVNNVGTFDPVVSDTGSFVLIYNFIDPVTGCENRDSIIATVHPIPVVYAGPDTAFCLTNIPATLTGYSPQNGIWSGPGVAPNGTFNSTITGNGSFNLTYTYTDSNGCTSSDSLIVTVQNPIYADAGNDIQYCIDYGNITLSGYSPSGGFWSGTGITDSLTGIFNTNMAGAGLHSLVYHYGIGNCETTDTVWATIYPLPQVYFTASLTCIGEPTSFQDISIVNATNLVSWSWNFGDGNSSTAPNPVHTYNAPGSYNVQLTVQNSNGCINDTTITVTIHPLPNPTFSHRPMVCIIDTVKFFIGNVDAVSYTWNFGDNSTGTGVNPVHTYTAAGTYTISVIAETAFGCKDSATSFITIIEQPKAVFNFSPATGCGPLTVNFTSMPPVPNTGNYTYSWNFGNGTTSNLLNPPPVVYNGGLLGDTTYHIYFSIYGEICNYTSIYHDSIVVKGSPTALGNAVPASGCHPMNVLFNNNSYGTIDSFVWIFGDGATSVAFSKSPVNHIYQNFTNQTIVYNASLIAYNECNIDTLKIPITVYPGTVKADISAAPVAGCNTENFTFYNTSTGAVYVYYNFGDNTPIIANSASSITHQYALPGTYTVYQHVYSGDSCSYDLDSVTITVYPDPISAFDFSYNQQDSCGPPVTVIFKNTAQNATGFRWDFDIAGNPGLYTSNAPDPIFNYSQPGIYLIQLVVESMNGCYDTAYKQIIIYPDPKAAFNMSKNTGCGNLTVAFSNTTTSTDNISSWFWDFGDGNTSSQKDPVHTFSTGVYTVSLTATTINGCTNTTDAIVTVKPEPVADFEASSVCLGDPVLFQDLSIGADTIIGIWKWSLGDGSKSSLQHPEHYYNTAGTFNVQLIVFGDNGCSDTVSKTVVVHPVPVADFTHTDNKLGLYDFRNHSSGGTIPHAYLWTFGDGDSSTAKDPQHQYQLSTYYLDEPYEVCLYVVDTNGCYDKTCERITVDPFKTLYVPNAFTPERGMGEETVFKPKGTSLATYHLQIFDTWGNKLWETKEIDPFDGSPKVPWDGTREKDGILLPQGVYIWRIDATFIDNTVWLGKTYNGLEPKNTGTVTLIR